MGICQSAPRASPESTQIDRQLDEDGKKFKTECKILLLGAADSGKSTIVKQMKIIHQQGFTKPELDTWRPIVWRNVAESAKALADLVKETVGLEQHLVSAANEILAMTSAAPDTTTEALGRLIHSLYSDEDIQRILEACPSQFYLLDSAPYFFSEILRISSAKYRPTEADVLRARWSTTAITETRFVVGQMHIHMFDVGGQRSERRKWIHMFESVTSIIFCVALSEYDQHLPASEDPACTNRLAESLTLFSSIVNSRWFLRTSIVLFLNKKDVFKQKVKKIPLGGIPDFRDFQGGNDVNKAAKYILWRFFKKNRAGLRIYPHLTQATDTENVRFVFSVVKETILQNALQDSGML
ncbi:heterotrimeric G protein alpha subunit C [Cylindrobasidium torrendii FP15055 ss-10]|uniref:Heterotrimeric G protein alpha subunit C n=1 Tax=Cylindrobasidium torrendii FP15055 ss-10 TaxID=1314674 RepID=A0A0D7BIG4_9AGAR|nr:heterotrimeric G protein alpha subunit C [Cylindrobasidium torrendii FP15055 ss-10]